MNKIIKYIFPLIDTRLKSTLTSLAASAAAACVGVSVSWLSSHGITDSDSVQRITEWITTGFATLAVVIYHFVKNAAVHEIAETAAKSNPEEVTSVKDVANLLVNESKSGKF